jgi:hypothetical protein
VPTSWQLESLEASYKSLITEIERVQQKDHPYPEPDVLYDALLDLLRARLARMQRAFSLVSSPKGCPDQYEPLFTEFVNELELISKTFNLADRVDSARIPFEILKALSWAANHLIGGHSSIVVRLDVLNTYSIVSWRRRFKEAGWGQYWESALKKNPHCSELTSVLVLGFPSTEVHSTLVHALAAHELGHEFVLEWEDKITTAVQKSLGTIHDRRDYEELREELLEYVQENVKRRGDEAYEASRKKIGTEILDTATDWTIEILCDLLAARLVGPGFIAALDRIVAGADDQPHTVSGRATHPPHWLRVKLVRKYLTEKFPHIAGDDTWKELLNATGDRSHGSVIGRICEDVAVQSVASLETVLDSVGSIFSNAQLAARIEQMANYMLHLAPPSMVLENGDLTPAAFWLIMYAAWHFRFDKSFQDFKERYGWRNDTEKAESALDNMVLHALQAVELRARWAHNHRKASAAHAAK